MHPVMRADLALIHMYKVWRWRRMVKAWSKRALAQSDDAPESAAQH